MIDEIWPEIQKAFAFYGKRIRPSPSPERRKLIQKRLDDGFTPQELVAAVHGYVHSHGGLDREFGNGLTSGHYLRPETVYKAEGFEDRVERGDRPWMAPKHVSRAAERDHRASAEREAYRATVMEERRLRAV
jgi:hypothetical protein